MSDITNRKLQTEIETLVNIIQLWIPVLNQMKNMHHNLEALPKDLTVLRQQLDYLTRLDNSAQSQPKSDIPQASSQDVNNILNAKAKLQKLISSLNGTFPQLLTLEQKISNLVALQEKLEALQEKNQTYSSLPNYEAEFSSVCQHKSYLVSPPARKIILKPKSEPPKTPTVAKLNSIKHWSLAIILGIGAMVTFSVVNMAQATANRESELNQRILDLETRLEQLQSNQRE